MKAKLKTPTPGGEPSQTQEIGEPDTPIASSQRNITHQGVWSIGLSDPAMRLTPGACVAFNISALRDSIPLESIDIAHGPLIASSTGAVFSDNDCSQTTTDIPIENGQIKLRQIFIKPIEPGPITLTLSLGGETIAFWQFEVSAGEPDHLSVDAGEAEIKVGSCRPATLALRDESGNTVDSILTSLSVTFQAAPGLLVFTDENCSSAWGSQPLLLTSPTATFSLRAETPGTFTFGASAVGDELKPAGLVVEVGSLRPAQLALQPELKELRTDTCYPFFFVFRDENGNRARLDESLTIDLDAQAVGSIFADPACTSAAGSEIRFPAGLESDRFFLKPNGSGQATLSAGARARPDLSAVSTPFSIRESVTCPAAQALIGYSVDLDVNDHCTTDRPVTSWALRASCQNLEQIGTRLTGKMGREVCSVEATATLSTGMTVGTSFEIRPRLEARQFEEIASQLGVWESALFDNGELFVAGTRGIAKSIDSGNSFTTLVDQELLPGLTKASYGLAKAGSVIVAGTMDGYLYSSDGGVTWELRKIRAQGLYRAPRHIEIHQGVIWVQDFQSHELIKISMSGEVIELITPGEAGGPLAGLPAGGLNAMRSDGADRLYLASNSSGLWSTSDSGISWSNVTTANAAPFASNQVWDVWPDRHSGKLYAATNAGLSVFDGTSWVTILPSDFDGAFTGTFYGIDSFYLNRFKNSVRRVRAQGDRIVIAVTLQSNTTNILISETGGSSWRHENSFTPQPEPSNRFLVNRDIGLWNNAVIVLDQSGLYRSSNLGASWSKVLQTLATGRGPMVQLNGVYTIGAWGSGMNYLEPTGRWRQEFFAVDGLSSGFVMSLERQSNSLLIHRWLSSELERSSDGGATWAQLSPGSNGGGTYFYDILSQGTQLIGAGHNVGFSVSADNGASWTQFTTANSGLTNDIVYQSHMDSDGYVYLATHSGLTIATPDFATWSQRFTDTKVAAISGTGSHVVVSLEERGLAVSSDHGQTWIEIGTSQGLPSPNVTQFWEHNGVLYAAFNRVLNSSQEIHYSLGFSQDKGLSWEIMRLGSEPRGLPACLIKDLLFEATRIVALTDCGIYQM